MLGQNLTKKIVSILSLFLISCAIIATVVSFFYSRSLWLDEAMLGINFRNRSFKELLMPLEYSQVAPIGFLLIEKFVYSIFNQTDLSLRIFPFVAYLGSTIVFYHLNKIIFNSKYIALIGCAIFCLSYNVFNYSIEVKQYMSDVLIAILLIYAYLKYIKSSSIKSIFLFSFLCAISLWFSNISIIILSTVFLNMILNRFNFFSYKFYLPVLFAIISFAIYYSLFIYDHPTKSTMLEYWTSNNAFLPTDLLSSSFYKKIGLNIMVVMHAILSFKKMGFIVLIISISGIILNFKRYKLLALLLVPLILHLGLSYFKLYPYSGRLTLYLIPFGIILFLLGIDTLIKLSKIKNVALAYIGVLLLVSPSLYRIIRDSPQKKQEIKLSLDYIEETSVTHKNLIVSAGSKPAFKYYKKDYLYLNDYNVQSVSYSLNKKKSIIEEIGALGNESWLLFSGNDSKINNISNEDFVLNKINEFGFKIIHKKISEGSSIFYVKRDVLINK